MSIIPYVYFFLSLFYLLTKQFNDRVPRSQNYLGRYGNAFEGTRLVKSCTARLRSISFASALHRFLLRFYLIFGVFEALRIKMRDKLSATGRCLSCRRNCKFQFARETEDAAGRLHQRHARHNIVYLMQRSRGASKQ